MIANLRQEVPSSTIPSTKSYPSISNSQRLLSQEQTLEIMVSENSFIMRPILLTPL